ncbi:MAG: preprotein translocase subunit YajC [Rhodospirillales bacterium]|nr:preprotein translocase subunit YajC [Rhodospirillales bacterium]
MFGSAFAQTPGASPLGGGIDFLIPMVLIFVVFYFLLIRPQQKKVKQHKDMLVALRRGDRIVTGGGIIGTVTKVVNDNEVVVEISEGVRVRVQRAMIASILAKTEPVKDDGNKSDGAPKGEPDAASDITTPKTDTPEPPKSGAAALWALIGVKR